ncbi:hypothetical protein EPN42_04140 [bacterium]|nr:MAG: hypothetical protein EPN42_04140 [bacterium]
MRAAATLTLADRWAVVVGVSAAVAAVALFVVGGQMIASAGGSVVLLVAPERVGVFALLALLVGVSAALQTAALRLRLAGRGAAPGAAGVILAFVGASCCTPLLWPAALSALGVSGVTLLGVNMAIHRWFWLAVVAAFLTLVAGIWRTARALTSTCNLS